MKITKLKLVVSVLFLGLIMILPMTGCGGEGSEDAEDQDKSSVIDYMVLVNKENPLPDGWEEALQTTTITNSVGDEVVVESTAYEAYLNLKDALEKEGIHTELDSAFRSIAAQQEIVDEFTKKYGEEYVKKYVAVPGYSEHHTGLALDLYLIVDDKTVYENEDLVKYPEIWAKIHKKLPEYGFILRYLPGKADITGYAYEQWHIRYIGDKTTAREMTEKYITLEEYLGKIPSHAATVDYGKSEIYTQEEMDVAITEFKKEFENWEGCELHSIRYAGDECNSKKNIEWLNDLATKDPKKFSGGYTQAIEFKTDFHSPTDEEDLKDTAWEPDKEYKDYQWWLARKDGGTWEVVSWGY